jgi:Cu-processing system ATP-binding protein
MADTIIYLLEGKIYFKGTVGELKTLTKENNFDQAIAAIATKLENV